MQRFLTLTELRGKLGNRSRSAIYIDLEAGRLPQPIKIGGRLYWPENDLEAWITQQAQRAKTPEQLRAEGAAMLAHAAALEAEGAR